MRSRSRNPVMKSTATMSRSNCFTLIAGAAAIGLVVMIGLGALSGCANDRSENHDVTGESQTEHDMTGESQTEHDMTGESQTEHTGAENTEAASDDGEESGESLALDETYDVIRKGARLILRYNDENNSFVGTVQNTTESTLINVRVEVHLSNGTELGPTTPVDLSPGESAEVSLAATEEPFTGWTPHAEVGQGEHGNGGEGEHREGGEGGGEHGGGGEGGEGSGEHGGSGEGGGSA